VLNELSRSMGQPDYYPFVLPRAAVGKLQFVHQVITQQREQQAPAMAPAAPEAQVDTAPAPAPEPELEVSQAQQQQQQQQPGCEPMGQQFQEQRYVPGGLGGG